MSPAHSRVVRQLVALRETPEALALADPDAAHVTVLRKLWGMFDSRKHRNVIRKQVRGGANVQ